MPKKGICPRCNREYEKLPYRDQETKQHICHACYSRIKRHKAKGISRSMPVIKVRQERQRSEPAVPKRISEPARKTPPVVPVPSMPAELITPPSRPVYKPIPMMKETEPEKEEEAVSRSDCCWVVDTANNRDLEGTKRLNEMIEQEPEKVSRLLKEIFRPSFLAAQGIIRRFLKTAEGKKLKGFIAQNPDLSRKAGVSH